MGTYNSAVITNAGQAMIAQSFAGSDLRFTTVKTSAYVYPAGTNFSELVTINSIKQSKGITGAAVYNSRVIKVSAMVDNAGIKTAYDINTIGVYASVGTDAEQLFAVITAIDADTMPAFNNRPYSYIYELNLTVGSTENLTVTVNNAGFVNVNDLNVAVEGKLSTDGNASQVTVDFTSGDLADSDVTKDTGYTPVAKVDSGETATSLLTKISNVIKNVRWIYKLLGTSDISSVGNGTVTNAVATLKSNVGSLNDSFANVNAKGIKSITRSGTTFTVTRNDDTTFTFNQQDTTYGLSSTTAHGLLRQLSGDTNQYLRGDGTWQTLQNSVDVTDAGYGLDARVGKTLQDQITPLTNSRFHSSINDLPSGYKAVQIIFDGAGLDPILYTDADKNAFIISCTWPNAPSSPANASQYITWINNAGTINSVGWGTYNSHQRVKLTYASSPAIGSWTSLNGRVSFIMRIFSQS